MRHRVAVSIAVLLAVAALQSGRPARADADPDAIELHFSRLAVAPAALTSAVSARDDTGRLFLTEQRGRVLVYRHGEMRSTPYLDVRDRVNDAGNEQGLLSIAFHPGFKSNRYLFVAYTDGEGDLRVSRFRASSYTANTVSRSTETIILQVPHRDATNHNGGQLFFGQKFLYITTGDGGGSGDPDGNAQDKGSLLGKVLRIDVDRSCGGRRYCSPTSNPFYGSDVPGRGEVWLYGLRNPWRASFDRATWDMWIGDVGQGAREEVDRIPAGARGYNLGWDCREGSNDTTTLYGGTYCAGQTFRAPLWEYTHANGRCSITGGYRYRGRTYARYLAGLYLFADYCNGEVFALGQRGDGSWDHARVYDATVNFTSFGEGQSSELFAVTGGGGLYRIRASAAG